MSLLPAFRGRASALSCPLVLHNKSYVNSLIELISFPFHSHSIRATSSHKIGLYKPSGLWFVALARPRSLVCPSVSKKRPPIGGGQDRPPIGGQDRPPIGGGQEIQIHGARGGARPMPRLKTKKAQVCSPAPPPGRPSVLCYQRRGSGFSPGRPRCGAVRYLLYFEIYKLIKKQNLSLKSFSFFRSGDVAALRDKYKYFCSFFSLPFAKIFPP